ncbi:MAG: hypothetical protein OEV00_10170 [Acidobacteriota bacterium]|nr:hypothetical protein [Acidobacteriota bacterium]MDH3785675.1 hypothetical protein [Acidobacteriota bacterium]
MTANSVRCFACGTRVQSGGPPAVPSTNAIDRQPRPRKKGNTPNKQKNWWEYDLDDVQKEILAAAARGNTIYVYGGEGSIEGEVKAGDERFYGNEAVAAVAKLVEPGLLEKTDDDCFELTDDGACLATSLTRSA